MQNYRYSCTRCRKITEVEQAVPPLAYPCDKCRKLAPLDTEFLYYGEPSSAIPESEKKDSSSANYPADDAFAEHQQITYQQQDDQGKPIPQTSFETPNDSVKQFKRYPWRPMKSNHSLKQGRAKWVKWVKWALIIYGGILAFYFLIGKGCEVENTDYCYYEDGKRECEEYIDYGDSYDYLLDYREY